MPFILIAIVVVVFSTLFITFVLPQFSAVPYFPSNSKDMNLILKTLKLKNKQLIIDLGAGDGVVIFTAAKKAYEEKKSTRFVALEINPILYIVLHIRRLFHPNRESIQIIRGDMFSYAYEQLIRKGESVTVYLYITPTLITDAIYAMKQRIPHFTVVSYMYPIHDALQPAEKGIHPIFIENY